MSGQLKRFAKATAAVLAILIAPQVGRTELAAAVGYIENAGAPAAVVPDFIGQRLFDTQNTQFYIAYGTAAGEWSLMGDVGLSAAELDALDGATTANDTSGKVSILRAGPAAGVGVTAGVGTVYRSQANRNGGIVTTRILIDLTGLASSTTDLDIIGVAGGPAHIGQLTAALNGATILSGTMTCLEVPTGGADDIDLYAATEGTGEFDAGIGTLVETAIITSGGAWTLAQTKAFGAMPVAGQYLYLTGGEAGTAATYTAGKFLIEVHGYEA